MQGALRKPVLSRVMLQKNTVYGRTARAGLSVQREILWSGQGVRA